MRLYFETINNDIVTSDDICTSALVVNNIVIPNDDYDEIRRYVNSYCSGITSEITELSVELFLKYKRKVAAVRFYYGTHKGISFSEAKAAVDKIEESYRSTEDDKNNNN